MPRASLNEDLLATELKEIHSAERQLSRRGTAAAF